MNAPAKIAKPAQPAAAPIARIVPSAPVLFPLRQLRRAAENVRHTRIDEDVASLAEDITAHGLLQSLIGYKSGKTVQIVGGGRRFQALRKIEEEGLIDGEFSVPVLIRDPQEAIELSLAENLQQRTMSPVDEFLAFRALMDRGDTSPAELAKRFGFSERVVKQRLRLADLATPIIDALAERKISFDSAMAYAATQDRELQAEVFKAEDKKGRSYADVHRPRDIKHAIAMKGRTDEDPVFRYVGELAYTDAGGTFEDDLFIEEKKVRTLANPGILLELARERLPIEADLLLDEWRARFSPTITSYLIAPDLRVKSWGNVAPKAASGYLQVDSYNEEKLWRTIRNNGIPAQILVGIDDKGELTAWPRMAFVPKEQKEAVSPSHQQAVQYETPEQRAVRERLLGVARNARKLAVGDFKDTWYEDRVFFPRYDRDEESTLNGQPGWLVQVSIFVSKSEVAEQRAAAEAKYDRDLAEAADREKADQAKREADDRRLAELEAMDPPAVVVVDGEAWGRAEDGSYAVIDENGDGGFADSWLNLLANMEADYIGDTFETRETFDDAMAAALKAEAAA